MKKGQTHSQQTKDILRLKAKLQSMERSANKGQFKKGHTPHNKGKPALGGFDTRFKKENIIGEDHPSWLGGQQVMSKDCVYLWTGPNKRIRKPKSVYEAKHGKIPKGFVIYHMDGNKHNDNINNLKAITRAELLKFNQKGRL